MDGRRWTIERAWFRGGGDLMGAVVHLEEIGKTPLDLGVYLGYFCSGLL